MAKKFVQAYRQAPWRTQLHSLGLYLMPLITIVVIGALHLIIGAQAAEAGLKVQSLRVREEKLQRVIADENTQLAWITSYHEMAKRAEKLGYLRINPSSVTYTIIPAYKGRETALTAPLPSSNQTHAPIINTKYHQSLWEWFIKSFLPNSEIYKGGEG